MQTRVKHLWVPLMSAIFLRVRGKVTSSLEMDSGVLSTSSNLLCSSHSYEVNQSNVSSKFLHDLMWKILRFRACETLTWDEVCKHVLLPTGTLGLGLSAPLLCFSRSLCSRTVCRVDLYSKEKLLMVLQKSSALVPFTMARE